MKPSMHICIINDMLLFVAWKFGYSPNVIYLYLSLGPVSLPFSRLGFVFCTRGNSTILFFKVDIDVWQGSTRKVNCFQLNQNRVLKKLPNNWYLQTLFAIQRLSLGYINFLYVKQPIATWLLLSVNLWNAFVIITRCYHFWISIKFCKQWTLVNLNRNYFRFYIIFNW